MPLPPTPWPRRILQRGVVGLFKLVIATLTRTEIAHLDRVPRAGPLVIALNHIGPLDPLLTVAFAPRPVRFLALSDLFALSHAAPFLRLFDAIPVYRGQADKSALVRALEVLRAGGAVALAPEGRQSVTGGLERARTGVAYLALATGATVLPVAFTGTADLGGHIRRLQRPRVRMTIGAPMAFERVRADAIPPESLRPVADDIMYRIAALLPPALRGVYADGPEAPGPGAALPAARSRSAAH